MTEDIHEALHRAAELLPDTPDRLTEVRRKRSSLLRRRVTAVAAMVAVAGAGSALALARGGGSTQVVLPADGSQELTATGRVVQVPGRAPRFCAPVGSDAMLRIPTPPPAWCELGVDVRGVDFTDVDDRYEKEGAVEGYVTLTGRLDGDVLVVSRQQRRQFETQPGPPFNLDPSGCTPPPGGWKQTGPDANVDATAAQTYQSQHPDQVADIALARPSKTQAFVYLLTWGDPAPVRAALAADYGDNFCVLQSRWDKDQYDDAARELTSLPNPATALGVYVISSHHFDNDGQLFVSADAVRQTSELAALVARHPAGLIEVDYWLHPVS